MSDKIDYNQKSQIGAYNPAKWNAADANEVAAKFNAAIDRIFDLEERVTVLEGGNPRLGMVTNLVANTISTTQINLAWGQPNNHNAETFDVYRGTTNVFSSATKVSDNQSALTYNNTGLAENTQYYFFIIGSATGYDDSLPAGISGQTGAPLVIPAADTNPVNSGSVSTNAFNWTNNSNYPNVSQREYTFNGGTTVAQLTAKPLIVGDQNKAAGQVGVRIKAIPGVSQASPWLFNTVAFVGTPVDDSIPLDTTYATLQDAVNSDVNTYRLDGAPDEYGYLGINSNLVLHAGTEGYISMDITAGKPTGRLTLTNSPTNNISPSDGGASGGHLRGDRNYLNGNMAITGRLGGNDFNVGISLSATKLRLRSDGTTIYAEWFDGTTWTSVRNAPHVGNLYIRGYMQRVRNADGNDDEVNFERESLKNVKILGFTAL